MAAQSNAERQAAYRERQRNAKPTVTKAATTATRKPRRSRKPTANQIATNVGTTLALLQIGVTQFVPLGEDALNPGEIGMLAVAAADEILANATLLKYYQSVGANVTGPHTKMAAALVAIALPRLARRGLVPDEVALMGVSLAIQMVNSGATTEFGPDIAEDATVQGDAGAAHSDNGHDGFREVRVGPGAPGLALVPTDSADEAGQHPIRN